MSSKKKKTDKKSIWKRMLKTLVTILLIAALGGVGYHHGRQIAQFVQIQLAKYEIYDGRPLAAISTYRYALRTYQENPEPYYSLAELYINQGADYQALRVYQAGFEATKLPELGNRASDLHEKLFPKTVEETTKEKKSPMVAAVEAYPVRITVIDSYGKQQFSTYSYDENNNVTAIINYGENGEFLGQNEYVYGADGRLTESKEYVLRFEKRYTYDENGFLVAETGTYYDDNPGKVSVRNTDFNGYVTVSNNGSYVINYTVDAAGRVVMAEVVTDNENAHVIENTYSEDGYLATRVEDGTEYEYSFDQNGNLLSIVSYDGDSIRNTDTYNYDEKGLLTSVVHVSENKYIVEQEDSRGKITDVEMWEPSFESSTVYSYVDGNVATLLQYEGCDLLYSYTYHYDENGILSSCVYYNYTSTVLCSVDSYVYDDAGNVIEQNTYYPYADKQLTTVNTYNRNGQTESSIKKYYGEDVGALEEDKFIALTYDAEGRVAEEANYFIDSYSRVIEEDMDTEDGGHRFAYSDYDPLGKKILTTIEMYDSEGRLYFRTTTNPGTNRISLYERFLFDEFGENYRTIYYNEATSIDRMETIHRNEEDFVDYLYVSKDGDDYRTEQYAYDENNRLHKVTYYSERCYEIYEYDETGRLSAVIRQSGITDAVLAHTMYEY